jgi:alkanesulfonate monooxygenase
MSGHPHVEEAYWFGEGVLPRLADAGLWAHPARPAQPAGGVEAQAVPFAADVRP